MKRKWLFALMAVLLVLCLAVPAMAVETTKRIKVTVTWNDNDDQDGIRPESVTVQLLATDNEVTDKTLTLYAGGNWSGSFDELPVYNNGSKIVYTVEETPVVGYTAAVTGNEESGFIITYSHTPEKTSVSGLIIWDDANNQDGIRPESVTVQLYADGNKVTGKTLALNEGNNWSGSFDELPVYNNGSKIVYTVEETPVVGYTAAVTGNEESGFIITYSHTPEKTSVSGSINWNDGNDQDGKRPNSVTVRLHKNGVEIQSTTVSGDRTDNSWQYAFTDLPKYENGRKIDYTVTEDMVEGYTSNVNNTNYTIANSYTPAKTGVSCNVVWDDNNNQDGKRPDSVTVQLHVNGNKVAGKTLSLNAVNSWSGSFDNLPEYNNGSKIEYMVEENPIDGYTCSVSGDAETGYTLTFSHTPEKTSVSVSIVWNDGSDQDGIRPDSVTVKLLADGVDSGKSLTLNAGNAWTHSFNDLPKYENGREISYTIAEVIIDDYTSAITGTTTTGYTITNSHTPDTINVAGKITWNDDNDRDRKRPASVTVQLFADTVQVDEKTVTPDGNGNWSFSFDGVAKYKNGQPIQYKVYLGALNSGYFTDTDGYNPIATRTPDKKDVGGLIVWDDDNDRDGKRPASVIVRVFQGDTELNHQTVTPDDEGYWVYSFANLLKNEDGQPINYTVSMDAVDGYAKNINGYTITNTHVPTTTSFSGWIHWDDDDNRDGIRPQRVTVKLYADGVYKAEETIGAEENTVARGRSARATNWYYSFENLLVNENGRPINYTVEMDPVAGYTTAMQGGSIVNIHEPETTTFRVRKLFKGLGAGEKAPAIQLTLYCNGEEYPTSMPTPDPDGWYVYTVPKRVNGQIAVYTAKVTPIAGFVTGYENVGEYVDQTEWLYDGGTSESHRLPKTGDESQLVLWLALAAVACAGVAVLLRKHRG